MSEPGATEPVSTQDSASAVESIESGGVPKRHSQNLADAQPSTDWQSVSANTGQQTVGSANQQLLTGQDYDASALTPSEADRDKYDLAGPGITNSPCKPESAQKDGNPAGQAPSGALESEPAKARVAWWPWLVTGLGLLLLSTTAGPLARLHVSGKAELAEAIAETDALDPNWRWHDLVSTIPKVPDHENGWIVVDSLYLYLARVTGVAAPYDLSVWIQFAYFDERYSRFRASSSSITATAPATLPSSIASTRHRHERHERLPTDVRDHLQRYMTALPRTWPLMQQLLQFPRVQCPVLAAPEPLGAYHANPNLCHRYFYAHEMALWCLDWLLESGSYADAEQCLLALSLLESAQCDLAFELPWRHYKHLFATPRAVERYLAFAELSPDTAKLLASQALQHEEYNAFLHGTRAARAILHEYMTAIENGDFSYIRPYVVSRRPRPPTLFDFDWGYIGDAIGNKVHRAFLRCSVHKAHALMLRRVNRWQRMFAQQPREEVISTLALGPHSDLDRMHWVEDYWPLGMRGLSYYANTELERLLRLRLLRAALAVERFRTEHGRWPSNWKELIPTYLPAPLVDLYHAPDSLLLKYVPEGVVIYSVGGNGADDGGHPELDVTFVLFDRDQRHAYRRP
ncbi:hypothetical protein HRbin36_00144 [bacterium HR36]|nr:hypothetical protein HRbin36_00144 [bacterium HR36]